MEWWSGVHEQNDRHTTKCLRGWRERSIDSRSGDARHSGAPCGWLLRHCASIGKQWWESDIDINSLEKAEVEVEVDSWTEGADWVWDGKPRFRESSMVDSTWTW